MNSRKGVLAVVMLSAAMLSACTSVGQSGLTQPGLTQSSLTPFSRPRSGVMLGGNALYFIGPTRVLVDTEYLDRYACADGRPITCERASRISGTAECRCY